MPPYPVTAPPYPVPDAVPPYHAINPAPPYPVSDYTHPEPSPAGLADPAPACPPVYFEDVLDTHRWVMQLIADIEKKVSHVPPRDSEGRDAIWREAVWTLGVQKRCLEMEMWKIKKGSEKTAEKCVVKDVLRSHVATLTHEVETMCEKSLRGLENSEQRIEALNARLQSVQRAVQARPVTHAPIAPIVQAEPCAEKEELEWSLSQCRQDIARKETELRRCDEVLKETRTQLLGTEEALEREKVAGQQRVADAIAENDREWQKRVQALQQQLLRHEKAAESESEARALAGTSTVHESPSDTQVREPRSEAQSGAIGGRRDMVDLLREVRSLEQATATILKER